MTEINWNAQAAHPIRARALEMIAELAAVNNAIGTPERDADACRGGIDALQRLLSEGQPSKLSPQAEGFDI